MTRVRPVPLLALLGVLLLVGAGVAAPAAGTAAQTQTSHDAVEFAFNSQTEEVGDVVEFDVETTGEPEEVWIHVTDDWGYYQVTFNVTGHDADEPIGVTWNTHLALNESNAGFSVDNGEIGTVFASGGSEGDYFDASETGHLSNAENTFQFESYSDPEIDGSEHDLIQDGLYDDVAFVDLAPNELGDVSLGALPAAEHDVDDDLEALRDAATFGGPVTDDDLVFVDVQVSGVYGAAEPTPEGLREAGLDVRFVPPADRFGTQHVRTLADLDAARVETVPAEHRVVVVAHGEELAPAAGDEAETWTASVVREADRSPYVHEDEERSRTFTYEYTGTVTGFGVEADAPDDVRAGEQATLDVTVRNEGDSAGATVVETSAYGVALGESDTSAEDVEDVRLEPGETWQGSFSVTPAEEGTLTWRVATRDGSTKATSTVLADVQVGEFVPRPYEGSVRYWDVDGDGELTQLDVSRFFSYQHRPAVQSAPERFDYSDNGRVSHGDVVELFRVVATDATPWTGEAEVVDAPDRADPGDVVTFELAVVESRDAWLSLATEPGDYAATVRLTDVEDERVDVSVDTGQLARLSPAAAVSAENATVDAGGTEERGAIAEDGDGLPGGRDLLAHAAARYPHHEPEEPATVALRSFALEDVETHAAPEHADPRTAEDVRASVTTSDGMSKRDLLVVEVAARGLDDVLAEDPAAAEGVDVELLGPEGRFGTRPSHSVSEHPESARIVPDPEAGRFYVLVESEALPSGDGEWLARATVDAGETAALPGERSRSASDPFQLVERYLELSGEQYALGGTLVVPAGESATVRAHTNVVPGTNGSVRVTADGTTTTGSAAVDDSGYLVGEIDLSHHEPGEPVETLELGVGSGPTAEVGPGLFVPDAPRLSGYEVSADAPETVRVGADPTLDVTIENDGNRSGYALAEVSVDGERRRVLTPVLEPGESVDASFDLSADAAGLRLWTVESTAGSRSGGLVVEDPRATVDGGVVGAPEGDVVEVPIRTSGEPETLYATLRGPGGEQRIAIDSPGVSLTLPLDTASGSLDPVGDWVEVIEDDLDAGPGEYELAVGTRRPLSEHVDDSARVVVGDANLTAVHGGTVGDEVQLWAGRSTAAPIDALTLRGANGDYEARLSPVNDTSAVELAWNTRAATSVAAGAGVAARAADLELTELAAPGGELEAGTYELLVESGGRTVERHRVELDAPAVEGLRLWTAAEPPSSTPWADVLHRAADRDAAVRDDVVIAEVRARGTFGSSPDTAGELADAGLDLQVYGVDGPRDDPEATLRDLDPVEVIVEPRADRAFVVLEPLDLFGTEYGSEWVLTAAVDGAETPYLPDDERRTADARVDYEERRLRLVGETRGGTLVLPPSASATVEGVTNAAPGTEVTLRVNVPRDSRTAVTEVAEDGTVAASVDLSTLEDGDRLSLIRFRDRHGASDDRDGVIDADVA